MTFTIDNIFIDNEADKKVSQFINLNDATITSIELNECDNVIIDIDIATHIYLTDCKNITITKKNNGKIDCINSTYTKQISNINDIANLKYMCKKIVDDILTKSVINVVNTKTNNSDDESESSEDEIESTYTFNNMYNAITTFFY